MRFLFVLLLTAVASYFALMIMPWWIPMLIGFCIILAVPMKRRGYSFLATGLGAALCYTFIAVWTDEANAHILSRKMAVLFHLPSYWLMIVITALIGFLTAGFGGWTAAALRRLFQQAKIKEAELVKEPGSS